MTTPSIELQNITFSYNPEKPIIKDMCLKINAGETIGIIGANGTGKSTLLKILVGLISNYSGTVTVEGILAEKKTINQIRQKIGYVFQDADNQLFMSTVYQDVAFGPSNSGLTKEQVDRQVHKALQQVNLTHLKDSPVHALSGGEKKLVSIATILAMSPSVILMDEPTIALDPKNRRNLINILNTLPQTKIITSHDLDFVWDTSDRIILLNCGTIQAQGSPDAILRNRELLESNGLEEPLSLTSR